MLGLAIIRAAWSKPPEPITAAGAWVCVAVIVAASAIVVAEADVRAYGLLCGVFVPAKILLDWLHFRSRVRGEARNALDRMLLTTALMVGWFAMLLMNEGPR